jgi:hypothetical protein
VLHSYETTQWLFAAITAAAAPAGDIPKMTREEALRYLDGDRYAEVPRPPGVHAGLLELAMAVNFCAP